MEKADFKKGNRNLMAEWQRRMRIFPKLLENEGAKI